MNNRLSHSSIKLYSECGKKYEMHYKRRLREATRSGALSFGTAFDKATEAVLKDRSVNEYEIFDKEFMRQDINGVMVYLPDSLLCVYAASDYDSDLLTEHDLEFLKAKAAEYGFANNDVLELYDEVKSRRAQKAFKHFPDNMQRFYNLVNWCCLKSKGHLMLKANREKVLPHITKVVGTQVEIQLANEEGDSVIGFADLVAQWDGVNEDIVFDYKTSARAYEEEAVLTSPQLAIYTQALGLKRAGFLVFKKQVLKNRVKICSVCYARGETGTRAKTCTANTTEGKRCGGEWKETISPEIDVQILIDNVPSRTSAIVLENVEMVNRGIRAGVYPRNFDNCVKPYGKCPYYNSCHKGDESELVQLPDKKD